MVRAAAVAACVILAALGVFQAALATGAPIGRFAWGGQHDVLPTRLRIGSAISIVVYVVMALILLGRADVAAAFPDGVARIGVWVLTAYFSLGVVVNAFSRSKPERNTFVPVCLVLAVLCLVVALSP